MNPKIIEILPKKKITYGYGYNEQGDVVEGIGGRESRSFNQALDEVTEALEKHDVCLCPSENELAGHIANYCNTNSLLYDGCKGLARAIRKLIMGDEK